jgi:hypothetical protein
MIVEKHRAERGKIGIPKAIIGACAAYSEGCNSVYPPLTVFVYSTFR